MPTGREHCPAGRFLATVAALILACLLAASCATPQLDAATRKKIDAQVKMVMEKLNIPGTAVGVSIPGRGEYLVARGKAVLSPEASMILRDHFKIGSETKTFTASTVLQLVDEGRLNLDDKVGEYVPGVPGGDSITIRMLLNHTSGLFNYGDSGKWMEIYLQDNEREWTTQELLDIAYSEPAYFRPGAAYHYSNTNYLLLGLVIEEVTGQSAEKAIRQRTIDRVGLKNTYFPENNNLRKPYARGYAPAEVGSKELVDVTKSVDPSCTWTAGAMVSTLEDLMAWGRAYGSGELLKPATYEQQMTLVDMGETGGEDIKYGLGVMAFGPFVGHGGEQPGYNCYVMYYPEEESTIAVFGNKSSEVVGLEGVSLFSVVAKALWPKAVTWY